MIDSVQLVLVMVIVVLAVLLIVLGIQVFFILKDLRKTIAKTNKVLDNAEVITENVTGPISSLSSFATNLRAGSLLTVAKLIRTVLSKDRDEEPAQKHRRE